MTGTSSRVNGTTKRQPPRLLMSAANYARHIGVTQSAISHAINRGDIVPLDNGLIDVAHAEATFGRKRALRAARRAANREIVERREKAKLAKAVADMRMMRRRAEQMHSSMVERDAAQASLNRIVATVLERVQALGKGAEAIAVLDDLGDLVAEALRVTQ